MKYIPFYPLVRFIWIIVKFGGLSGKGILHLLPWVVKLTLLEPLRWLEVIVYDRRIARSQIAHPPVFILGHYRSGTTLLQRIFMHDTRFATMSAFEHALPDFMLLSEKHLSPVLQGISDFFRAQNHFHRIPFSWSQPGEEDLALVAMTSANAVTWGFLFPRKFKHLFDKYFVYKAPKAIRAWKKDYLYLVSKVNLMHHGKPLVLKSPPNTARARELLELFPQAKFIYLHRAPEEVFVSTLRLWQVVMKLHVLGSSRNVDLNASVAYSIRLFHQKWEEDKCLIPPGNFIEVRYEDLKESPIHVMQDIYSTLQLPDFKDCEPAAGAFLEAQKSYKTLRHDIPKDIRQHLDDPKNDHPEAPIHIPKQTKNISGT